MKNTTKTYFTRQFYNWYKNSFLIDEKTKKRIIVNDCLNVKDYQFRNGIGNILLNNGKKYNVTYISKMSKDGFDFVDNEKNYLIID